MCGGSVGVERPRRRETRVNRFIASWKLYRKERRKMNVFLQGVHQFKYLSTQPQYSCRLQHILSHILSCTHYTDTQTETHVDIH